MGWLFAPVPEPALVRSEGNRGRLLDATEGTKGGAAGLKREATLLEWALAGGLLEKLEEFCAVPLLVEEGWNWKLWNIC
jgi:hypothetical protein